jgi:protein-disulfide isomerase
MAWINAVYASQDSLGIRSWRSIATQAGVSDPAMIERCVMTTGAYDRLERGRALGDRVHIRGTPTVLINGWKFTGALSPSMLDSTITALVGEGGGI